MSQKQSKDPDSPHAMAIALEWVSRIMVVSLEMVLPGVAGQWLDSRYQTSFFALLGFALGITLAIWHLIAMTRPKPK
jgi:hypothetical protein